jgi:putative tricarboxylic transport membrane protein
MPEPTRDAHQTRLRSGTAVLCALLAIYVMAVSLDLGYWTDLGPGPGFFPFWSATIILVSAAGWLWNYLVRPSSTHDHDLILGLDPDAMESKLAQSRTAEPTGPAPKTLIPARLHLPVVIVSLAALILLLPHLGFQLAMFLFLLFQLKVVGGTGWVLSLAVAAAGSFGVFVLFTEVLQVLLPTAGIPFLRNAGL